MAISALEVVNNLELDYEGKGGIYYIINKKDVKFYIGMTKSFINRSRAHYKSINAKGTKTALVNAFIRDGVENFIFVPIIIENNIGKRTQLENKEIAKYDPGMLYNYTAPKVYQFTLLGKLVNVYKSLQYATKETGLTAGSISQCATGKLKHCGNYYWTYDINGYDKLPVGYFIDLPYYRKLRNDELKVKQSKRNNKKKLFLESEKELKSERKKVLQIDITNGEIINTFASGRECAAYLDVSTALISQATTGITKVVKGYYLTNNYNDYINLPIDYFENKNKPKPINKVDEGTNKVIEKYDSVSQAAKINGIKPSQLSNYLNGRGNKTGLIHKMKFVYAEN